MKDLDLPYLLVWALGCCWNVGGVVVLWDGERWGGVAYAYLPAPHSLTHVSVSLGCGMWDVGDFGFEFA